MIIREARPADTPSLLDFQLKMALETESIQLEILPLTQGMHKLFRDPAKGRYYVAEEAGELIGCLMTTFEWSEWRCGTVVWIQSVYVSIPWRKKGVFKAMYDHVYELVTEDPNLKGIRLYVDKTNAIAQKVYTGLGMNGDHYTVYEWMKA